MLVKNFFGRVNLKAYLQIRTAIIRSLRHELLGPRQGLKEEIKNPDFEYLSGVLVPKDALLDPIQDTSDLNEAIKTSQDERIFSMSSYETLDASEDNPFDIESSIFESPLDPRSRPKSLGISFAFQNGEKMEIDVCITFARYRKVTSEMWRREPFAYYIYGMDPTKIWDSKKAANIPNGIGIYVLPSKASTDSWNVSIYLVNETHLKDPERHSIDDLIFQPQIRIICGKDTKLVHFADHGTNNSDQTALDYMYKDRRTYARGHMCSAMWKQLESTSDNEKNGIFEWIDAASVPSDVASHFRYADLRTEYLPCYSIQQPGIRKSLSAQELSDMFQPDQIRSKLETLTNAYENWIQAKEVELRTIKTPSSQTNLDQCKKSLQRMKSAINLICDNEKVRLAFCFMNSTMNLQFKWDLMRKQKNIEPLIWYEFQLAFILQCLEGIVRPDHEDRNTCDLLWFSTGGGKTEAYLALMTFSIAYRRLTKDKEYVTDGGISVISRYTLRLLTIQQFRRAARAVLACDALRVMNWRPKDFSSDSNYLWGKTRFSLGLWVGQDVTPNKLEETYTPERVILGALGTLKGKDSFSKSDRTVQEISEPAQIMNCPCCDTTLAIPINQNPDNSIIRDGFKIMWIFRADGLKKGIKNISFQGFEVDEKDITITQMENSIYYSITIIFKYPSGDLTAEKIDNWWKNYVSKSLGVHPEDLCCARPSTPGYFIKYHEHTTPYDFEIRCPNLNCQLNKIEWFEELASSKEKKYSQIIPPFQKTGTVNRSIGIPISAYTVDTQIYRYCPSFLIATVDKFARLPYESHSASIFGNVDKFDSILGYFRKENGPESEKDKLGYQIDVKPFLPPTLIIQDELHLIDGPLGSITGLFETAIDALSTTENGERPKYIVSTATIKNAEDQVLSLFDRKFALFPPPGLTVEDSYFTSFNESALTSEDGPGRLYFGVCTPGKTLLPIVRIWSSLLKEVKLLQNSNKYSEKDIDSFWTLVGYFNSLKELAIARAIYSGSEIRGRIGNDPADRPIRELDDQNALELSGQSSSLNLPTVLRRIEKEKSTVDALFTTSMFGTGIDISRLSLMVIHGQPKNTSSYIQATGRVGRQRGGLVITLLRSTRPRDLNHYEYFAGYHRAIQRFVEPVSVYPFSPKAVKRMTGPMVVTLLRNARYVNGIRVDERWYFEPSKGKKSKGRNRTKSGSREMKDRRESPEIEKIIDIIEERSNRQPCNRRPESGTTSDYIARQLQRWEIFAKANDDLLYWEQTMSDTPIHPAVLGSPQYDERTAVFLNAPTSLREVEPTCGFGDDVF